MKQFYFLGLIALLITNQAFSQSIEFQEGVTLFTHPNEDDPLIYNPFLPINLNDDGVVDFVGSFDEFFDVGYTFLESEDDTFNVTNVEIFDQPTVSRVLDYNNDGLDDAVFSEGIWINGEEGLLTFELPEEYDPSFVFDKILDVADFNSDGIFDILVRRNIALENDEFAILMSTNEGDYSNVILTSNPDIGDHIILDINNDGFLDVGVITISSDICIRNISIFYNDGQGSFSTQEIFSFIIEIAGSIFTSLEFSDMDADGDLDIIHPTSEGVLIIENLGISEGIANFREAEVDDLIAVSEEFIVIKVGDMNNDGLPDIIGADDFRNDLYYLENDGIGGFMETQVYTGGFGTNYIYPEGFTIALSHTTNNLNLYDLDSDGDLDIIFFNQGTEEFVFLENRPLSTSTSDFVFSDIIVSPNPSSTYVNISSDNFNDIAYYRIVDIVGKPIQSGAVQGDIEYQSTLNGSYFLQLFNADNNLLKTEKITVLNR